MGRWTTVALATAICLLLIAGAQRSPWIAERMQQTGVSRLAHLAGLPGAGVAVAPPQPFTNAKPPAWSSTDSLVTQLQKQLKERPDDPLTPARYAQLGSLYLQKARETGDPSYYTRAEGALQQSLEMAPENPLAMIGMGGLSLARHEFAEAVQWGERTLQQVPNSYVAYGVIGDGHLELGNYPAAIDALQKMVDLRPDLSSLSRVSYARELHGDLTGAIEAMQQAVAAGAPRSEGTTWSRVHLGHLYFLSGDLETAERHYRVALQLLPEYAHALGGLARVAAARGDLKEAISLYTRAVQAVPWPEHIIALGDVYRAAGNPKAAAAQDDLVRAIGQLQRAGGVDVDLEMALFEVDHARDGAGIAAGLQAARTQYLRRPSIQAADVLAWALYRAGRAEEALPYAREALRLGTKDPLMLFHAGAIAAAAGEPAEARGYLESALALQPQFSVRYSPEARRLLDQVRKAGA